MIYWLPYSDALTGEDDGAGKSIARPFSSKDALFSSSG